MAELKTKQTKASVARFIQSIPDEQKRTDSQAIVEIMKSITRSEPRMWGPSIVGFGDIHLKYDSGRELDWFLTGFSPRKQNLTVYLLPGFSTYDVLLKSLGKHKTGKGCLYFNRLEDVHVPTLKKLISESVKQMRKHQ